MITISDLLTIADAYHVGAGTTDTTLSHRMFGDSKKLPALRVGADITVGRFNAAVRWLSQNWPDNASWPKNVDRPANEVSA